MIARTLEFETMKETARSKDLKTLKSDPLF